MNSMTNIIVYLSVLVSTCSANIYSIGCGGSFVQPSGDIAGIIGGTTSVPHSWPWQVSIQLNNVHHCGGSVISNQWILTASHCLFDVSGASIPLSSLVVKVGLFDLTNSGQVVAITNAYTHPQFRQGVLGNDIALIKMAQSMVWSKIYQPICIPFSDQIIISVSGTTMTVTGWGDTISGGGVYPDQLMQVNVGVKDYTTCSNSYQSLYGHALMQHSQFCAAASGKDSCSGDSGGPLIRLGYEPRVKAMRWFQYGVVSFGGDTNKPCDNPTLPGVYTRVSYYCAWIQQTSGLALCS